ncbi:MAG TPA: pyridoxamine 5'-phosphate oxidase family protein [Candidatus Fimousia stercorigallinarum]|nr:pyridoxamine 5'-phosphate oxidase family protein [Candidatus Fimousia stercorigallinarum]
MFREMRRKRQLLSQEDAQKILYQGTSGVLAVSGDDDYPYAVPLSYVYDGQKIYFHSAKSGHKLDSISKNPKVSFCVIDKDQIVPDKYTTYFRSVIVFGTIRILQDGAEKREAVEKLAVKYAPDDTIENRKKMIEREWNSLCMLELVPEHITGKAAIEDLNVG